MPTLLSLLFLIFATLTVPVQAAETVKANHSKVTLVAEQAAVTPGETVSLAVVITLDPEWYTYWKNPGDTGMPARFEWSVPDGAETGDAQWPTPQRLELPPFVDYGYYDEVAILTDVTLPDSLDATQVSLAVTANWLVCKEICIPESGTVSVDLPVGVSAAAEDARFTQWRAALPLSARSVAVQLTDSALHLKADLPDKPAKMPAFFPETTNVFLFPERAHFAWMETTLYSSVAVNDQAAAVLQEDPLRGLLVVNDTGYRIEIDVAAEASTTLLQETPLQTLTHETSPTPLPGAGAPQAGVMPETAGVVASPGLASDGPSLLFILLLALIGGIILNVMPCVFPVLSLKALSACQEKQHQKHAVAEALAYTAGVVVSFLALAGTLIAAKSAAHSVGWGFHMQAPLFVMGLTFLIFTIALNLSNAFSPSLATPGFGGRWLQQEGLMSHFMTGALAVFLASPCTAPFMATAVGYSLSASTTMTLATFTALGVGLALPYVLVTTVPALSRRLPKPGAWMETFKQAMAFPLYATVIWLLYVLLQQTNALSLSLVLSGLLLIAFVGWLLHRLAYFQQGRRHRPMVLVLCLALAGIAYGSQLINERTLTADTPTYSLSDLPRLQSEQKLILVNVTADWCLICKYNELTVLARDSVTTRLAAPDAAYILADWTLEDPEITRFLESFQRAGVPLYVVFRPGEAPVVLPQLLSVDAVLEALAPVS